LRGKIPTLINRFSGEISFFFLQIKYDIFGELENGWEEFRKDVDYEAFLIKSKN